MIWVIDKVYIGYSISSLYYQLNWNSSIIGYVDDKRQYSNNRNQYTTLNNNLIIIRKPILGMLTFHFG